MQQTYFMIKPEIMATDEQKIGAILAIVNAAGFRITGLEMRRFDRALVEDFYGEHRQRPFYQDLCDYITSGPVVTVCLERENAVAALRELIGATNPEEDGRAAHFDNARVVGFSGAGHWVHHDRLDGFLDEVRAFLS